MSLDRQIIVRVTTEMHQALQADADANGRTLAQTVRHLLRRALDPLAPARWGTAAVVDSRRSDVADRHATLVYGLRDIHHEREGYCNCCGGQYPCVTIRLANELAGEQSCQPLVEEDPALTTAVSETPQVTPVEELDGKPLRRGSEAS